MMRRACLPLLLSGAMMVSAIMPAGATTLDEAITAALAHAPEIAEADAEGDAAKGRLQQARSGGLPQASLSGTYGFGRLNPQDYFGLPADNVTPRAAQATIEQPLFAGGRVKAGIDQARAGIRAAQAGGTMARSQIAMATAQAYGDVLVAAEMLDLYSRLTEQTAEIQRQAKLRYKAGETPSTDVQQAAARLAEAQAGLARAEGVQVSAQAHYRNLTGLEPADLQPLPPNPPLPATLDEAMSIAMENSPALRQAEAGLTAAEASVRGARGERLPAISAFAEAGMVRDQFFPGYIANSATVGVRGKWDLFAGGRISGKLNEAHANVRAAEAQLRAVRRDLEEGVLSAWSTVHSAQAVEKASEEQADAAAQALDSVRHEVRVGMKPQIDLLNAEREAIAAAASAAQARTGRIVAAYQLNSLIGR